MAQSCCHSLKINASQMSSGNSSFSEVNMGILWLFQSNSWFLHCNEFFFPPVHLFPLSICVFICCGVWIVCPPQAFAVCSSLAVSWQCAHGVFCVPYIDGGSKTLACCFSGLVGSVCSQQTSIQPLGQFVLWLMAARAFISQCVPIKRASFHARWGPGNSRFTQQLTSGFSGQSLLLL